MPPLVDYQPRTAQPLYRQVEFFLREQISSGTLRAGDMLPSVRELCEQFGGINHLTVRQAIKNLSEDRLVRSVRGQGTFVTDEQARDQRIAILLPQMEDLLFLRLAKGAQEVFHSWDVHSILMDSRGSEEIEASHIESLRGLPLNGALIFPIANSNIAEQIFRLKLEEFHTVLLDRYFEDVSTPCVLADNYRGGYLAAEYLAQRGRRQVAWVGELGSTSARLRLEGSLAALNDKGIACPGSMIQRLEIKPASPKMYRSASRESVRAALEVLLRRSPRPDGIICCDDETAIHVLDRLEELEIRVPHEIAVTGFDDISEAAHTSPPLTTVRQPMLEIGRAAALMLLERLENGSFAPEKKVLPVELVVRESA